MATIARARTHLLQAPRQLPISCLHRPAPAAKHTWRGPAIASSTRSFSNTRTLLEKRYTEQHEWIELSADRKLGTIGISSYAARALGDVTYVELPATDAELAAGDAFAAVESVKSASDIYAPCRGTVAQVNVDLEEKPEIVGKDPEGPDGWLARIDVEAEEADRIERDLMDSESYKTFTEKASQESKH